MTEHEIVHRFRLMMLGYAILALTVIGGVVYNQSQQDTLDKHQKAIMVELRGIKKNQDAIRRLTVNTAAAICLEAYTNSRKERIDLISRFNNSGVIITTENPACTTAVRKAELLVFPQTP